MHQGVTAWLERPTDKDGLDNLGTQQPCVFIYSRLLPGVTNVTDRAHYFGFYPWFVHAFVARNPDGADEHFVEMLRRADCLVTLIAERHAAKLEDDDVDRHAGACPGRRKLAPAAAELRDKDDQLKLSVFANRDEANKKRYFKNRLGGLGQYYLGQLRDEYNALRGEARKTVNFTFEVGEPLAQQFAQALPEDAFFAALEKDGIGLEELDALSAFCPCALAEPSHTSAHTALKALLLESETPSGQARRRSFDLLLRFFHDAELADVDPGSDDEVRSFLKACYANQLPGGDWALAQAHEETRFGWALYARNEMLSLAWLAIFKLCLDAMGEEGLAVRDVGALCDELLAREQFAWDPGRSFAQILEHDRASAPALTASDDAKHEFALWRRLAATLNPSLEDAARMLVRLLVRFGDEQQAYGRLGVPASVMAPYPLTLDTLSPIARRRWADLDGRAWIKALMVEAMVTHQRVALRKMGQSGEDTLMIRAGDNGYFREKEQERVVVTQPRLRQAVQILRDLDLIVFHDEGLPTLTVRGAAQLAAMSQ